MKKNKFQLITTACRRCGKPLLTGNRSIHGATEAKVKYDRICADCVLPEEQNLMLHLIGQAITKRAA